ncbi:MAG: Rid family detoxifying hydrolase [Mariprofundaceae bacterium]|nr:Rid family detoxifying hydrolase [Mariprofundaceae bacterium]
MFETIHSDVAPAAVGPYAQAIRAQGMLFTSGQIGLNPQTGKLIDDTLVGQANQVMGNLRAVLAAADCQLSDIVKVNIYLLDMADFPALNALYADWLGEHRPARATVAVAALPLGARVEMDVIARCV